MNRTREAPLRVIVASEDPTSCDQITRLVEREQGVKVVGQACNAVEAVARARILRPEVTLVDPYLPYRFGVDGVPLSRMSGLDVAMSVAEELPGGMAILVSNPDPPLPPYYSPDTRAELCRYTGGFCVPLSLRQLRIEMTSSEEVVFANVWVEEALPRLNKAMELSDQLIGYGVLALMFGFAFFLTIVGVIAGIVVAGMGVGAILVGFAIKGVVRCLPGFACDADTPE